MPGMYAYALHEWPIKREAKLGGCERACAYGEPHIFWNQSSPLPQHASRETPTRLG